MKKYVIENDEIICKELKLKYVNSDDMFSLGSNEWFDESGMIISEENIFDTLEEAQLNLLSSLNQKWDKAQTKANRLMEKIRKL